MSNILGERVRLTSFGESHGKCVGAVLDGIPSGLELDIAAIQERLDERKPKMAKHSTQRAEADQFELWSGVFEGKTTGAPITLVINNEDTQSKDYELLRDKFRPGHADYTYHHKYPHRDHRGGGRSSIRVWAPIVAAGDICRQYLEKSMDIEICSFVSRVGKYESIPSMIKKKKGWQEHAEQSPIRMADAELESEVNAYIDLIAKQGDTLGGGIHTSIMGMPIGIGEPLFDKLNAKLGQYIFSINTVKALAFGEGNQAGYMTGKEHNDELTTDEQGNTYFRTNHGGGMLGGISTGEEITMDIVFKPISSHRSEQNMLDIQGKKHPIAISGRHDVFAVPRAIPIVNAMCYLAISDLYQSSISRSI